MIKDNVSHVKNKETDEKKPSGHYNEMYSI